MNAPVRFVEQHARRRFTADEVIRMTELGLIGQDARLELMDGDLIDMPSEGELHVAFKIELVRFFVRALGDPFRVAPDATLHLAPSDAPEPDLYVLNTGARLKPIAADDVRLVLEIAESSIAYDLGRKSGKYASYAIAEYWVVDVPRRCTHVLRDPDELSYRQVVSVPFDQPLQPLRLPGIALVIADLPGLRLD